MSNGIFRIFDAIKARYDEKHRDRKEFKVRQSAMFNEGLIQFKLREQLQKEVDKMNNDPGIISIKVQISPEAIPFLETVTQSLNCKTQQCPMPDQIILIRQVDYL